MVMVPVVVTPPPARNILPAPAVWATPTIEEPVAKARVRLVVPPCPESVAPLATVMLEVKLPKTFKVPAETVVGPA